METKSSYYLLESLHLEINKANPYPPSLYDYIGNLANIAGS